MAAVVNRREALELLRQVPGDITYVAVLLQVNSVLSDPPGC